MERGLYGSYFCIVIRHDAGWRRSFADCQRYEIFRRLRRTVCSGYHCIPADLPALHFLIREDYFRSYRRRSQRLTGQYGIIAGWHGRAVPARILRGRIAVLFAVLAVLNGSNAVFFMKCLCKIRLRRKSGG